MPDLSGLIDFKFPNPLAYNLMWDDFNGFDSLAWSFSGMYPAVLQEMDGGVVALSTLAGPSEEASMAYGPPSQTITPSIGKDLIVAARIQLIDVTEGGFFFGLCSASSFPLTTPPDDGMYFRKLTGNPTGQFTIRVDGTNTCNVDLPEMASLTWYDLVFTYKAADGVFRAYVNDGAVRVATNPTPEIMGTAPMGLAFSVRSSDAAVEGQTLLIDNYLVAKAR